MREVVLAVIVLACTGSGLAADAPQPAPAAPGATALTGGAWRSERLQAGADELVLTLELREDGTADLFTEYGGGAAFLERGTWRRQGAVITVLVFEPDRPPSPNEMTLEPRGDTLVPVRWDPEFYGKIAPGVFRRRPEATEGEP
jgi:hypothetical protein